MDNNFYSEKTIEKFIKTKLCLDDKTLYRYYENEEAKKFRKRFVKLSSSANGPNKNESVKKYDKNISEVVITFVTDSCRDLIVKIIAELTVYMKPFGDLIISGGEAFNMYFNQNDRIITNDIDTKFIPIFKSPSGKLINPKSYKFFGYLQVAKLLLWNKLGEIAVRLNNIISKRIDYIKKTKVGKVLGISLPLNGPYVTRRYSLIKKQKHSNNLNISPENVFIDVELFTLDLKLRYFNSMKNKVSENNLGGILDIAFMRPFEFGSEIVHDRSIGITYTNPITRKMNYTKNVLVAGKGFLLNDLYLIKLLNLRPNKKQKDKKRLHQFVTKIVGLKIKPGESDYSIIERSLKKVKGGRKPSLKYRPVCRSCYFKMAKNVNPLKYEKYTTPPLERKIVQYLNGIRARQGLSIKGYKKTSGKYRFNVNKQRWTPNNTLLYVKNELNYRPDPNFYKVSDFSDIVPRLHSFNPKRNKWIPKEIINKSAMIPFVGLKNKTFLR